jgi:hypothetical protein
LLGDVSISQQAFDDAFPGPKNAFTLLDAGPEANAALDAAAAGFNDATFHTGEGFGKERTKSSASFLAMLYE